MVKKKKIELNFEEEQIKEVKMQLDKYKRDLKYIPEPTYKFNIGESVKVGNLKDVKIDEILEDGKIYVVAYTNVNNNYGNPIITEHCKRVFMWLDLRKVNNSVESFVKNKDIKIYYSQRTICSLFTHAYHFGFNFEPEYQRGLIWSLEDKTALIDSIFNNVDIGKFAFIKPDDIMDMYEVLDGKQRLTTLLEYYEDRFEYKGKTFSQLSYKDKTHIENYNVAWGECEHLTEEQKLRYFLKLNTTGKPMDTKHLDKIKNMLEEFR